MFLKSLTLRGFKSFADKTELVFEPGITIVVGPNGSGKSNIIDSVSWVLGEQGPKSLRGGKMEDVIFAGSSQRPALGMAEVTLTIDNSSGVIPIEFTEFTITRSLFRSGDSEYRLNGVPCRLLDIQEILSDTGIGREQHTIIGQGQLDEILQSDPIQMRDFIEEAAGVAKHRRRKDRALRKIASAEENIARLSDLLSEIRRQLRPLREQAEVAKRHSTVAEELGRVKLVLGSRELAEIRTRVGGGEGGMLDDSIHENQAALAELEGRLAEAEDGRAERFGASEKARDIAWNMARLGEKLLSISRLASERSRTLQAELAGATESAAQARLTELQTQLAETEAQLGEATRAEMHARGEAEGKANGLATASEALAESERHLTDGRALHRDLISEAVRIRSEIGAMESTISSSEQDLARLVARRRTLETSREESEKRLEELQAELVDLEARADPQERAVAELESEAETLAQRTATANLSLREAERELAAWRARSEVRVRGSKKEAERIVALGIEGVVGILSFLVEAPPELRAALGAVAGTADSVIVVRDVDAAERVVSEGVAGEAIGILVSGRPSPAPAGSTRLSESMRLVQESGRDALAGVFLVSSLAGAARLAAQHPEMTFVTKAGGVAAGRLVATGPADVAQRVEQLEHQVDRIALDLDATTTEIKANQERLSEAVARVNQSDAVSAAAAERLRAQDREAHALERELQTLSEAEHASALSLKTFTERLESMRSALPRIEPEITSAQLEIEHHQEAHANVVRDRDLATAALEESRFAEARATEKRILLSARADYLTSAIAGVTASAVSVEERRRHLELGIRELESITDFSHDLHERASAWAEQSEGDYQSIRSQMSGLDSAIAGYRTERAGLAGALEDLRSSARRRDAGLSEWLVRARMLEEKMREEWSIDPIQAVARFGHVWEVEDPAKLTDPLERLALLDDDALRRRRQRLEHDLSEIGQVNPFAAREFQALTDRERFLGEQIADVRRSRRDLFKIVASIDEHIRQTFADAFDDVSREYQRLLQMLFPGGNGRLRLTDPQDLLQTGIEVEVRPGGKNLKRLSLLSGGEKALAALAVLFAIFRARPSPFYVLDEVEAALDDVNLHRFLSLLDDFRETAQLLVVTHQKRTMEAADVLYGISIRPDGSSRVISERMTRVTSEVPRPIQQN